MANVTLTTNSAQVPSGYMPDLIKAIRFNMIMPKLVEQIRDWNKGMGQTIHQNRTVNWAKGTKVPDSDIVASAYTIPGDEIIYIDTFDYAAAQVEDFAAMFLDDAILKDMKESQAYALNRGVEVSLNSKFSTFSASPTGTSLTGEVNWGHLVKATGMLERGGINVDAGDVNFVGSIEQRDVFKQDALYMNSDTAGSDGLNNLTKSAFAQKRILGVNMYFSPLLNAPAAGGHDMAMFYKKAMVLCYAGKPKYFEQQRALPLGKLSGFMQAYGIKLSYRHVETPGSTSLTDSWAVYIPGV